MNSIADTRKSIQQLKDDLRSYNIHVEDKPDEYPPARQALDKAISKQAPSVTETERTRVLRRASFAAEVLRGAQILWVDDHPSNNLNERQILRAYGVFIDLARSSEEALAMLEETRYDQIVSDMGRQGIKDEGLRFLEETQHSKHMRPLIFYTVYAPEIWKKREQLSELQTGPINSCTT